MWFFKQRNTQTLVFMVCTYEMELFVKTVHDLKSQTIFIVKKNSFRVSKVKGEFLLTNYLLASNFLICFFLFFSFVQ